MFSHKTVYMFIAFVFLFCNATNASIVTLGQQGLMSLDYNHFSGTLRTQVIDKSRSGDGVRFDIAFMGNTGFDSQMLYGSSVFGEAGELVFADLSEYDQFSIDVELVEFQGYSDEQAELFELWFSPMVHDSSSYKFFNSELLSTREGQGKATASMNISSLETGHSEKGDWIFEIGYEIHMDNPGNWPSEGATVTLLLTPSANAKQIIPEPMTMSLLAIGAICLSLQRKKK